jgi:PAS domain-containing protein
MFSFEGAKQALGGDLSIWTSHAFTILFTSVLAGVSSFAILRKEKQFRFEQAASAKRHRLLFERSLSGVYQTTLDGRIRECNDAFCRILGYRSHEELSIRPGISTTVSMIAPTSQTVCDKRKA